MNYLRNSFHSCNNYTFSSTVALTTNIEQHQTFHELLPVPTFIHSFVIEDGNHSHYHRAVDNLSFLDWFHAPQCACEEFFVGE
jgi:hypothetical protein